MVKPGDSVSEQCDGFVSLGLLDRALDTRGLPPIGVSLLTEVDAVYSLSDRADWAKGNAPLLFALRQGSNLAHSAESMVGHQQTWFCCWWQSKELTDPISNGVLPTASQPLPHFLQLIVSDDGAALAAELGVHGSLSSLPKLFDRRSGWILPESLQLSHNSPNGSVVEFSIDKGFTFVVRIAPEAAEDDPIIVQALQSDINVGNGVQRAAVARSKSGFSLSFEVSSGECFYGTGEDFGPLEKSGRQRHLINADALGNHGNLCYHNLPTVFSSRGLAWSLERNEPGVFDVSATRLGVLTFSQMGSVLRASLLARPSLADSVRAYRSVQAKPASVPQWSYGLWLSRCYYKDEHEVRAVIAEAKSREVSVSAINLDARCWMKADCRTDFQPDATRFPDFFGFVRELSDSGIAVSLWENPYVSTQAELYAFGARNGFFARTNRGSVYPYQWVPPGLPGFPQPPIAGLVDFTNPGATEWWKDLHRPLLRQGVLCFKTDFGEEIPFDACFSDGRTGSEMRNIYADLYNQAVFSVVREMRGDQGVLWARSAFRNAQAYPVKWAGDGQTNWRSLRATLRSGLSQAFGGALFWSNDGGGFYGTPPDPELYVRWVQMALWCSHVRLHGTTPREPWCFGEAAFGILRTCLQARDRLQSFFVNVGEQCVAEGRSFIQPLCLLDDQDARFRHTDDQFAVGDDLVVAPYLDPSGGRTLVLPKGTWVDMRTGAFYEGPCQLRTQRTPFLPVYFRQQSRYRLLFEEVSQLFCFHRGS
jgi:alpha-D-xyloside xylohydrolase